MDGQTSNQEQRDRIEQEGEKEKKIERKGTSIDHERKLD
ncbi:unnamed protein product [Spirodela intermedia]|uniref:Uncharacterized protein n=1 Tax=Spirodela intermedia TaxID=51605 RepID=A0A7I8KXY2_SPIIN|nr:unnamed protein product [Spirodela intermedia]